MEDERNPAPISHVVVKLTEHEADFCLHVLANPGCKLDGGYAHWQEDGSEYGEYVADYENPERVGLVENTGGKRWKPTQKLIDLLKSALTAAPSPSPSPSPKVEPLFWYRPVGVDGGYEGPIPSFSAKFANMPAHIRDQWKPLYPVEPEHKGNSSFVPVQKTGTVVHPAPQSKLRGTEE